MLDRSPGIAIPDETLFIPQLAHRHRSPVDAARFLDDLRRLSTIAEWGVPADDLVKRLRPGMTVGEALDAVLTTYAEKCGKPRWGDKTPMYMRHLGLIDRLFPEAQYVHLVRDGRDVALAFLDMPEGIVTRTWAHPQDAAGFACEWSTEVTRARMLGRRVGESRYMEVRYEDLVTDASNVVESVCEFAGIPYEPAMLEYTSAIDVSEKPHLQRMLQPPTRGVRDWRSQMSPGDVLAFEAIAGDLLEDLGYERKGSTPTGPRVRARASVAWYRARIRAWDATAHVTQRSPVWRRRHPLLF